MARKTFGRDGATIVVSDSGNSYAVRSDDVEDGGTVASTVVDNTDNLRETQFDALPGRTVVVSSDDDTDEVRRSYVDPATIAATAARKPRRKRSPNKPKPVEVPQVVTANLEKLLVSLHLMGSALLSEPELQIDQDEAKLLADALAEVATAWNWSAMISSKTQSCIDMGIALATVYGKRGMTIYHKHRRKGGPVKVQPIQQNQGLGTQGLGTPVSNVN